MANLRAEIRKALKVRRESTYWLAKKAGVDNTTVYTYLAGKRDTNGVNIGRMLAALDLEVRPKQ